LIYIGIDFQGTKQLSAQNTRPAQQRFGMKVVRLVLYDSTENQKQLQTLSAQK
jgi:hypothetical protein